MQARNRKTGASIIRVRERAWAHTDIEPSSLRRSKNNDIEYDHCDAGTDVGYEAPEAVKFIDADLEECPEADIELFGADEANKTTDASA